MWLFSLRRGHIFPSALLSRIHNKTDIKIVKYSFWIYKLPQEHRKLPRDITKIKSQVHSVQIPTLRGPINVDSIVEIILINKAAYEHGVLIDG